MASTLSPEAYETITRRLITQELRAELRDEMDRLQALIRRLPRFHQPRAADAVSALNSVLHQDTVDRVTLNNAETNIEDRVW